MDTTDAVVLRQLTDRIVVYDDRLEIHLRIGRRDRMCLYTDLIRKNFLTKKRA